MAPFRAKKWIVLGLILFAWSGQADDVCRVVLTPSSVPRSAAELRHLELVSRLDRLEYLRVNPPRDSIQQLQRQIRDLESRIRVQDPARAENILSENRLQALDELYSHFAAEKEKYDAFHPSWEWRRSNRGRNEEFGRRLEKITIAYMKAHEISFEPHYEGRLRDGVVISPDAYGSYLNRLAFRMKRRLNVNLVVSPRNLVREATDGMFAPGPRDVYVSKDFLRTLSLETTTRHELVHAYIDSFTDAGIPTPYDAEVTALERQKISSYGTSGYDDYEDASEVATYAEEVADGGKVLRAAIERSAGNAELESILREKLQIPAEEGLKLTRAMMDSIRDAIQSVESHRPLAISVGRVSEGRNPAVPYVEIPVGNRATLTLRMVGAAIESPANIPDAMILSRLRQMLAFHDGMLSRYSQVNEKIMAALSRPTDLDELADATLALKRFALSELSRR